MPGTDPTLTIIMWLVVWSVCYCDLHTTPNATPGPDSKAFISTDKWIENAPNMLAALFFLCLCSPSYFFFLRGSPQLVKVTIFMQREYAFFFWIYGLFCSDLDDGEKEQNVEMMKSLSRWKINDQVWGICGRAEAIRGPNLMGHHFINVMKFLGASSFTTRWWQRWHCGAHLMGGTLFFFWGREHIMWRALLANAWRWNLRATRKDDGMECMVCLRRVWGFTKESWGYERFFFVEISYQTSRIVDKMSLTKKTVYFWYWTQVEDFLNLKPIPHFPENSVFLN